MALPSFNVRPKDRSMRTVQRMEYNDRLIAAVHKRPILWDCGRSDHKDYRKKHTVWMEVLREVGKDPEGSTVQARWKGLRDTFVKKHKTWAAATSNGTIEGCKEVRWPYFKLLMFLKDQADVFGDVTSNTEPNEDPQEDASSILLHICNDSEETGMVSSGDEDEAPEEDEAPCRRSPHASLGTSSSSPPHASVNDACVQRQAASSNTTSSSLTPRKRRKKEVKSPPEDPDEETDKCSEETDSECALFGQIVARKMSKCPKRLWTGVQIELLEVLKRYEQHQ